MITKFFLTFCEISYWDDISLIPSTPILINLTLWNNFSVHSLLPHMDIHYHVLQLATSNDIDQAPWFGSPEIVNLMGTLWVGRR